MEKGKRGSIAFFATYRPPLPLDVYCCTFPSESKLDERPLLDGIGYNCNAHDIPKPALKAVLERIGSSAPSSPAAAATDGDVDAGLVSGLVFVSERTDNLETLHIAVRFAGAGRRRPVEVFNFAELYGAGCGKGAVRMEDSGCFAGDSMVYVSTVQPPVRRGETQVRRREPWTAVYKTDLRTGKTDRLTPPGEADLSPAVSPSGKMIAVASLEQKAGGWDGEIEDLMSNIFIMDVENPNNRKLVIKNGGWPTWGSDDTLFFHRKVYYEVDEKGNKKAESAFWHVFRADVRKVPVADKDCVRVTPMNIDAVTPAAIDANRVAVATIRQKSKFSDIRVEAQYRHIEIFDSAGGQPLQVTLKTRPKADHYNPFVVMENWVRRIGYHRTRSEMFTNYDEVARELLKLPSPMPDVELLRVPGVFPTFSKDGKKLAFVDNEFKALWVADELGLRVIYEAEEADGIFSPVWNQNAEMDILYFCRGRAFHFDEDVDICAIPVPAEGRGLDTQLTDGHNNAFPSTNPQGTKLVYRSTRDGKRNLYLMEDAEVGEFGGDVTRLTNGDWVDSHCQWSPSQDWIVFASTRDKPKNAPPLDHGLDPGYYAMFLLKMKEPYDVLIRVIGSGDNLAGHINHPAFSPDGGSIVFVSDLAGVSCDPISLPLFVHSVRPYGDIFSIEIDKSDIRKNKDIKEFTRLTHSKYENSTASWTLFSTKNPSAVWNMFIADQDKGSYTPECPYLHEDGAESFQMLGHLCISKRCC